MSSIVAEQFLNKLQQSQNFGQLVLQLVATKSFDVNIRFAASLLFKNFVRRNWMNDDDGDSRISTVDRDAIKSRIVDLMTISEARIQLQLSDAVTQIADSDFPQKWQGLIPELVSKLNPNDFVTNNGLLQTAHSIFQRWRPLYPSDNLYTEIKIALESFCEPYRQVFLATDAMIQANPQNVPQLKVLFETLYLLTEIYHDLNCHDIPEFFVTHLQEFLGLLHKYMIYENPLLVGEDEDSPGPVLQVKASICEVVELYSKRYEEDFTSLPEFIQTSWSLLTTLGLEPRNDSLVSKAMSFLTSVVKNGRHRDMFSSNDVLSQLCEKVILPNMGLRESDEELFEDEPIEYIRRDLEGSDSETRRRAATELVRGLLDQYPKEVTAIISTYIQHYLQRYSSNVAQNWKDKDAAMFLLTSIAAKSVGSQFGARETNAEVNILDFFEKNVIPDLTAPVSGAIHPILKVDAIKYLYTFRGQFSKDQHLAALPLLVRHLESTNYAVYTYAAICIERVLFMRVSGSTGPMFSSDDIAPQAESLISNLFHLIELGQTPEKLAENDYLMKCVMRVILTVREKMLPLVNLCLARLTAFVQAVSSNPSNPKFNHYVFESIGALIRFICTAQPEAAEQFESLLFQPFQVILQQDIAEFTPYVFQLLSQLLSFHTRPELSPAYQAMLPPLVQPTLWQQQGNIPALVKLLQAYLQKGSSWIIANNHLEPLLGVFQKLASSKINDHHAFELLQTMIVYVPMTVLGNYMKTVLIMLLTRLQSHKTDKFKKGFVNFSFFYMALDREGTGPDAYWALFDSVQTGLFVQFLKTVWLTEAQKVSGRIERKTCAVAMVRLVTGSKTITEGTNFDAAWPAVMTALVKFFEAPQDVKGAAADAAEDDVLYAIDIEETGYQAQFSQLATTSTTKVDPTAPITDPKQALVEGLVRFNQAYPGRVSIIHKLLDMN
ncbi:Cse1-domain-containing protein [Gamsiella multidivaricata]|uniref:Cse1-domain-containing protein n=1 Tax=Gamsiella multidivaricata TaxID=101098 RepID=UPI0022212090|nr:Cse1-domain-containing protein [Gamsiella multidivaricata]KAI7823046.1 Cse1-domain-containing protein [Gamsiella multidivaricata]